MNNEYTFPMLTPDQVPSNRLDLGLPYAKLARHITAMYEIVRLAPTNDPARPGSPSLGLSLRDRSEITKHLRECLDMIATIEKWALNPVAAVQPERTTSAPGQVFHMTDHGPVPGARSDRPEDYLPPEFVRRQREMQDLLRYERLLRIRGEECPSCGRDNSNYGNVCTSDDCPGVVASKLIN